MESQCSDIQPEIRIIDSRERRCQAVRAQMGLGADGTESVQIHFQPALHRSARSGARLSSGPQVVRAQPRNLPMFRFRLHETKGTAN